MKLVIALILLVLVTVLFHIYSPWWFTPIASNWSSIDTTIDITLWVTGVVFIAVNLFMAYAIYRYRYNKNRRAHYEPENKKLELGLTLVTAVGVIAMLAPGLVVWGKFINVPDEAQLLEVVAQQWHWSYRLPGDDGLLGEVDARYISPTNPFGINPKDPNGQDDRLIAGNEIHLPLNKPVKVLLRSKDVLHNFAVPQFRVKMDMVPGLVSYLWFTPTRTGSFEILCMELCGLAHHTMRGTVTVDSERAYGQWREAQPTFAATQKPLPIDLQLGASLYATCAACHGSAGEGVQALKAPRLAGLDSQYLMRQLRYYQTGVRGANAQDALGQQMAPMAALVSGEKQLNSLSAYIGQFPVLNSPATLSGDTERGRHHYRSCSSCHGSQGQGNLALKAPRLAGQHDWYLKQQLLNFKAGVRGAHRNDDYGDQMMLMARVLTDDQAIDDLLAYLNQLE